MAHAAILLVDDEPTILESLKGQLKRLFGAQFIYETADDVPEAWEVIGELVADGVEIVVIVSDWLMPGIRGDEFLCDVRAAHGDIATIMLTGHAEASAVRRVLAEGEVLSVLFKPWSEEALRDTIDAALAGRG